MLRATDNKGFVLTFENGVTISVQFGYNNYCEVRDVERNFGDSMLTPTHESKTAEILIEDANGENLTDKFAKEFDADTDGLYSGWNNADMVADAINWAKSYKEKPKHKQLHNTKVVNIPFEFKKLDNVTNGTITVDGRTVLIFDPIYRREHSIPSDFDGGYLALSSLDKNEREHFFFNSEYDVPKLITGIGLQNNLLIVQVNDAYVERKTQLTFFAPSWLVESYPIGV